MWPANSVRKVALIAVVLTTTTLLYFLSLTPTCQSTNSLSPRTTRPARTTTIQPTTPIPPTKPPPIYTSFETNKIIPNIAQQILSNKIASLAGNELMLKRYMNTIGYNCSKVLRLGHVKDGGWNICADKVFAPSASACLVYSFGIKDDWTFDDAISKKHGCVVHSFDPSRRPCLFGMCHKYCSYSRTHLVVWMSFMPLDSLNATDHDRSALVHFHKIGLSDSTHATADTATTWQRASKTPWNMKTFSDIVKLLKHERRTIDVVKMDIEGWEFPAISNMLQNKDFTNIKQLVFEFHMQYNPSWRGFQRIFDIFIRLERNGFRKFHYRPNVQFSSYVSAYTHMKTQACHEIYYVNTRFLRSLITQTVP